MRIAILTREFLPETRWGGIGSFYSDLVPALRDAGHDVEVFSQGLGAESSSEEHGVRVHLCRPRWYLVGAPRGGDLGGMAPRHLGLFALSFAREIGRRLRERHREHPFDLAESHEHLGIGAFSLGPRAPRHIVRYHAAYDLLVGMGLESWPSSRAIRRLERRVIRRAELRVACSKFISDVTPRHFAKVPETDLVIPHRSRFSATSESALTAKKPIIAFSGRLVALKRPLFAAQAFAHFARTCPEWSLEVAGRDGELADGLSVWSQCESALASCAGRYRYHGPANEETLSDLYRRASVILIPSSFEAFGLVALEAMTFGCIPIVAKGTALEEVVGDAGIVLDMDRTSDVATRLVEIARDPHLRHVLGERSIARARNDFSRSALLERNLEAYRRVAGSVATGFSASEARRM